MSHQKLDYKPILAGILSSLIFGFSFLFTKLALTSSNNNIMEVISFRFGVAAIILLILKMLGIIKMNYRSKDIKPLFVLSLFYPAIYFICESAGIKLTSTSEAGTMIALIPIFVTLLASIFLKEKTTPIQKLCIFISVGGVIFINLMKYESNNNFTGIAILFAAVISAAIYNILSRKMASTFTSIEITYIMMWAGAIFFNLILFIQHLYNKTLLNYFNHLHDPKFIFPIIYLGIFSSIIAFFLMNYTLAKLNASKASSFSNLSTVVSIAAGVIILKEDFSWYHAVGILLILFGIWGVNKFDNKSIL